MVKGLDLRESRAPGAERSMVMSGRSWTSCGGGRQVSGMGGMSGEGRGKEGKEGR